MIRHAIERPVSTLVAALTLVVLGGFSLLRLPVALLPAVERPRLVVTVAAADASRDEMLHRITEPVERDFLSLAGVTSVISETGEGFARVMLETQWQADADRLRIEAERRLAAVPTDAYDRLTVEMEVGDRSPIVEVAVSGGNAGARAAFTEDVLVPELARLSGAGRLEVVGRRPLHATVRPRTAALAARGLTAADVRERLESVGRPRAAGRARQGGLTRPLVVREAVASLEELGRLRLGEALQLEVALRDVADIGVEERRDGSWFHHDGEAGVLLRLYRAPGTNAVALARSASARVAELNRRAPVGLRLELVRDRSREVVSALGGLGLAALAGFGLGTLVLRWMLGRWRPTLALAVVIPASVVTAFAAFYAWDISLDVVSLAGLALAAGMLVDNSIVVLEAIATAREQGEHRPVRAAVAGTQGIAPAVVAGFLTTAVVFVPLIYLQGLARAFFGVQAFAIVTSLFASLLLSLTVTPVLSGERRSSGAAKEGKQRGSSPGLGAYRRLLSTALARPWPVILLALALIVGAGMLGWRLPRELMPDAPPRQLDVAYRLPPGLTPEAAEAGAADLERAVAGVLAATTDYSLLSYRVPPEDQRGAQAAEGFDGRLELAFQEAAAAERALPLLEEAVARVPGVEAVVEPRAGAFVEVLERARRRLEIVVTAETEAAASESARQLAQRLQEAVDLTPRLDQHRRPQPILTVTWDARRLGALGVGAGTLEEQVRAATGEVAVGRVEVPGLEPELYLLPTAPAAPEGFGVRPAGATVVPLAALARLDGEQRPPRLERIDGRPALRLHLDVPRLDGALVSALDRSLTGSLESAGLSDGEARLGGAALELQRSFGQLRLALLLAVVLVFLTLAALYESLSLPLVVMSSVPAAAAGAVMALAVGGQTLNVLSFLGVILLTGIVVNNAIVLVHQVEEHRRSGAAVADALARGAAERYRPILMTTLTTLLGMLPLVLLGGEGVELRRALSLAVVGGLVTSTFASLLLVPALYTVLPRRKEAA